MFRLKHSRRTNILYLLVLLCMLTQMMAWNTVLKFFVSAEDRPAISGF